MPLFESISIRVYSQYHQFIGLFQNMFGGDTDPLKRHFHSALCANQTICVRAPLNRLYGNIFPKPHAAAAIVNVVPFTIPMHHQIKDHIVIFVG